MRNKLYFGENVEGYSVPVLNEREARAGAGVLLLPAITSFFISYFEHDFHFTKVFITIFMVDFFIRLFVNPKYAPSLIIGRLFVQNQIPEYVGAEQKKFAWSIGMVLSVLMFFVVVVFEVMTPFKIIICLFCIALLFSEAAFGICLGCIMYQKISKKMPQHCPGGTCEMKRKDEIQKTSKSQLLMVLLFSFAIFFFSSYIGEQEAQFSNNTTAMKCGTGKCGAGM